MLGSPRHRRGLALATCVLWLLGIELLPNLHLAAHHHAHTHAADGAIVWSHDDADHDHDHADHADHDLDDHHDHDADQTALDHPSPARHQAGGLAHHAVALHRPPPPLLAPLTPERAVWRLAAVTPQRPSSTGPARPSSRGPPSV